MKKIDRTAIEALRSTGQAYGFGATLTKEEAIQIWLDRTVRKLEPETDDLNDLNKRGWMSQMSREVVEGFLKNGVIDNSALTPEEIDTLLGF